MMKSEEIDSVTLNYFADLIGVTPRHVGNLVSAGIVTRAGRGKIALRASIRALLADARRSATGDKIDAEQAALIAARREAAEMNLAARRRELVPLVEALGAIDNVIGTLRHALDSVPARLSKDPATRNTARDLIDDALHLAANKIGEFRKGNKHEDD